MNALHFFFHFKQQKSTYRRGFFLKLTHFLGCDSWKQLVMLWLRDEMTFKKLGFPAGSKVFF